ncbi:MAG: helix-turn-helix domain-containing protein [Planctomycetota bacterium]|jgi:AraC-like DNA-binding protein
MKTIEERPEIKVMQAGVSTGHPLGATSSVPDGFKFFVVLCYKSPFRVLTENGKEMGRPGDCLVMEPNFPQWHTNLPDARQGFVNDWCHIAAEGFRTLLEGFDIPLNRIISTGNPGLITHEMTTICNELKHQHPMKQRVIGNAVESLLIAISRAHLNRSVFESYSRTESEYLLRFTEIRNQVSENASENWTVRKMAGMVNLSTNRFSVLYRKFFGQSPVDDLLSVRMELAKYHLASSNATLETIADTCGFSNVYYFSRLFKKRAGCTPGEYRRSAMP